MCGETSPVPLIVIPAKAGIHLFGLPAEHWIPAYAGMTNEDDVLTFDQLKFR